MSQQPICIIGAGIAGLVLGRCLLRRGIPAVIYERDSLRQAATRHGYGITLQRSAYQPLLKMLSLDEKSFRRSLAVDTGVAGNGFVDRDRDRSLLRANRRRLEELLREGLDIRWDHELADLSPSSSSRENVGVIFHNGVEVQSSAVVGADGPHSRVRKAISPSSEFKILPYAVFNGKRRVSRAEYEAKFTAYMAGANVVEQRVEGTLLQISLNNINDDIAGINYVYSRPAREGDPLFKPHRPNSGATAIPEELFEETRSLAGLKPPFSEVFKPEAMRKDRLLNWLMRSVLISQADLGKAASGGIVLVGDAAHHGPILGSYGANEAISDAFELADYLGGERLADFSRGQYSRWASFMEESERQLARMHGQNESGSRL